MIITVAIGVLDHEHSAPFMLISGLLLGITTVCCCCMNFRRSRMIDWELPHKKIHRFAARWSRKRLALYNRFIINNSNSSNENNSK